ncbi:MAG: cytochrome c [Rhodospirillaceae bacterium]|jgi:mono/diheme cytochrome c family protein|nr:cytochrome c [Rhodospirillales bacterium]MBT3905868.1 cytochrome c [Rhodospirillaceae bacterium]MBT4703386.1 cytochrome c [Rhodospirillaceae bacterium]MBT5035102.1 cytochrome c [Rhodospirillaceae bacterium]MBT6221110.1 cytochrome c [Rhodospirillaceae bacterium]
MPSSKKRKKASSSAPAPSTATSSGLHWSWYLLGVFLIAIVGGAIHLTSNSPSTAHLNVTVPALAGAAASGGKIFAENCVSCHGANAAGSDSGPPLVHKIYEPNHHGDGSFYMAAKRGVRPHHWKFGPMPPMPNINDGQMVNIVAYIRTLQRANGIF